MNIRSVQTRKRFHRISITWIVRGLKLFSLVMPYRPGVWLGGMLGRTVFFLFARERRRTAGHLRIAYPDRDEAWIRDLARRNFEHYGRSLMEMLLITPSRLARITDFPGFENLKKAHAQGKGVIYVTGHIGNWELSGGVLASHFPLYVVAAMLKPDALNDFVLHLRERLGIKIVLRGMPGATKDLIRVFKENRVLGLLIDQDTDVDGTFVEFMGRPAWTPTAAASMALKFGAPVVFGHARREKNGRHSVFVEGPLELIRTGNVEQDIIANTRLFTGKIEDCVRQQPEQWVWMHRRWSRQP